ncbi:FAD-dependent thymidylate synthase, partial [Patescibacteria group bacterium]|nr:FAD-dependent thymidylate synthase [Patescibacteria group bacterium]
EFALTGEAGAGGLIKRVVTAYGDDSVQQLTGLHLVVENASIVLTKLLEWGRIAAYLEQSTRYIYFDQKGQDGRYRYRLPDFPAEVKKRYVKDMDRLFELYSEVVRGLTTHVRQKFPEPTDAKERQAWIGATRAQACDAARPMLPAATTATVGIYMSAQAVESLIIHLLSEELPEARTTGQAILTEARKVIPAFLERADLPTRGGAMTAFRAATRQKLAELAVSKLRSPEEGTYPEVQLLEYWPQNETDLVLEIFFQSSSLSLDEIKEQVKKWSVKEKEDALRLYTGERFNRRHKPGRAFEKAHFEWEITADYGTFRDLQRHRMLDSFEWQAIGPSYGYEVPEIVKEAGFEEQFREAFAISEKLYSYLQEKGETTQAQYGVLLGYRMRYRFIANVRELFHFLELRTSPQGHPGYRRICNQMYDRLKEVYPVIAGTMRFVNQDEDPELTRMAAELATQYKLEKLDREG